MGNHNSAKVVGKGDVELQIASSRKLLLLNVLHVSNMRKKHLMSTDLLNKKGFKVVLESNKIILSKYG